MIKSIRVNVSQNQKRKQIEMMRKKMAKFGIDPNDLGIFTRPEYKLAHDKKTQ